MPGLWMPIVLALSLPARAVECSEAVTVPWMDRAPRLEDFLGEEPEREVAGAMARVEGFTQREPSEGRAPTERTAAYLGRDGERLYVVFVARDRRPGAIRARSSRRDELYDDDRVGVWLDTFSSRRRAVAFMVNPRNVQGDFEFADPDAFDLTWDAVWDSRAALTRRGYVVWMAIPFSSLRFPSTPDQRWRLLLERTIAHKGEDGFWPPLSSQVDGRARQFAALDGVSGVSPGRPVEVAPYTSFRSTRQLGAAEAPAGRDGRSDSAARLGFDAKVVLHDSVVVDATVNPDFSQIESDQPQVLVNQRYEVPFAERRPFFLENAALFRTLTDGGRVQLFVPRRIQEPRLGLRATGRLGAWTAGALVTDDRPLDPRTSSRTSALDVVSVLRRDLPGRSDVGLFGAMTARDGRRNLVGAAEARLTFGPSWSAAVLLAASSDDTDLEGRGDARHGGTAAVLELRREGSHLSSLARAAAISPGFRDRLGFVPRTDLRAFDETLRWRWRPGGRVIWHGPVASFERTWDHAGHELDGTATFGYELRGAGETQILVQRRVGFESYGALRLHTHADEVQLTSAALGLLSGTASLSWGRAIDYNPAAGLPPALGASRSAALSLTFRPGHRVRLEETLLLTRLGSRDGVSRSFDDRVFRSTLRVQLSHALSLRFILDHHTLDADPRWSSLSSSRTLGIDALLAYELRPATALYVGYGSVSATPDQDVTSGVAAAGLRPVARQLYFKASYPFHP